MRGHFGSKSRAFSVAFEVDAVDVVVGSLLDDAWVIRVVVHSQVADRSGLKAASVGVVEGILPFVVDRGSPSTIADAS